MRRPDQRLSNALRFEPGEGWEYSVAIDWAGLMVERANDGVKLGEYMRKHIWDSLGMTSTTFHLEISRTWKQDCQTCRPGFLPVILHTYLGM